MGGAQAVAALAYGTETVQRVDVVVGPGNVYVQEAKRKLSDVVGIDCFAGPSDLLVVLGADADPRLLALDLLAQAEHGRAGRSRAPTPDALAAEVQRLTRGARRRGGSSGRRWPCAARRAAGGGDRRRA